MINPNTLRHHRTRAGLSQRQLAKIAGLGPLGIKRIEDGADAGRLPLAVVGRIADAIGITIDQLVGQPSAAASGPSGNGLPDPEPLNYNQAKLLRRLQRGEDITRRMTRADRELTLPILVRAGALVIQKGIQCSPEAMLALSLQAAAAPGAER